MKLKFFASLAIITFLLSLKIVAQTDSLRTEDVFNLSLEDLMDVKVTTASKSSEKIQAAPAVISVMGATEIEGFGAIMLSELLDRLTSTFMVGTSFAPNGMLSIRGKQTEHYNTNVLILLDGRPLRESFHGGYNGVIYSMFPVNSLQRIEIIRGPGSVLYGTNAYVGVINLISKESTKNFIEGTVKYGTFNTVQGLVSVTRKLKDLDIVFAANTIYSEGWDFSARGESDVIRNKKNTEDSVFKAPTTIKRNNEGVSGLLKLKYKGITLNTFAATNSWFAMNRITDWPKPINYKIENNRLFVDLGYEKEVNEFWSIGANVTYNHFTFRSFSPSQSDDLTRRGSDDVLFEITNHIKPVKNVHIVIGGLTNMQSGKGEQPDLTSKGKSYNIYNEQNPAPWQTVPKYDMVWNSAYIQVDYTPIKQLKLIAGAQANKIPGISTDYVPRLGAIISANDNLGLKLLYGQAFRAATAFERFSYSPPSVYGNVQLTAEKITTYEAQLYFTKSKLDLTLTYFYNFDNNKIVRENVKDTLTIEGSKIPFSQKYVNSGYVITQGIELEAKYKIGSILSLYGSSTYQSSKDNKDRIDYDGMPNLMIKYGVLFNYKETYNAGLFGSYFGSGGSIYLYNASGVRLTKIANPAAQPFNDISLNLSANITRILKLSKFPDLLLQAYLTNLLDEKIYYQEVVRRNINSLPGRPGRAINIGITVRF